MPNLSIKDVPEEIAEALRQRAARNHRSLQGELMFIIHQAVGAADMRVHGRGGSVRSGTRTVEDIAQELFARYPEPIHAGPLGVDIIREDRDSR